MKAEEVSDEEFSRRSKLGLCRRCGGKIDVAALDATAHPAWKERKIPWLWCGACAEHYRTPTEASR